MGIVYWNLGFKASDIFYDTHKRVPGDGDDYEKDVETLSEITKKMFETHEFDRDLEPKVAHELVRYGGSELHNIGALMGGVASQAVLKLLTEQYVPFSQTFTFCGINCQADTFKF